MVAASLTNVFAQPCLIYLPYILRPYLILIFAGIASIFLAFVLKKTVKVEKKRDSSILMILKESIGVLGSDPQVIFAIIGFACARMISITCSSYVTFAVTQNFEDHQRSEREVHDYLSVLFM